LPDDAAQFTTRFRLTREDARAALWFGARDWVGWVIGVALLTVVCAVWPALGTGGRIGAFVFPALTILRMVSLLNGSKRIADEFRDRDLVLSLNREGLGLDFGDSQTRIRWAGLRRIVRGDAVWLFHMRHNKPFFVPATAIPVEARALVARWASEFGVRLD